MSDIERRNAFVEWYHDFQAAHEDIHLADRDALLFEAFKAGELCEVAKQDLQIPKPDWSKAPEWATWWAMHAYGDAFWFENKPYLDEERYWQVPNGEGAIRRDCDYLWNPDIELLQQRPKE